MSEWDNYCDEIGGVCKDMEAQAARIAELEPIATGSGRRWRRLRSGICLHVPRKD